MLPLLLRLLRIFLLLLLLTILVGLLRGNKISTNTIVLRGNAGPVDGGQAFRRKRQGSLLLLPGGLRCRPSLEGAKDGPDDGVPFGPWADAKVLVAQRAPSKVEVAACAALPVPLLVHGTMNWRLREAMPGGSIGDNGTQMFQLCGLLLPLALPL